MARAHPITEIETKLADIPEWQKLQRGELHFALVPELSAARRRSAAACDKFNRLENRTKRNIAEHWKEVTNDPRPLPPVLADPVQDDEQFNENPYICAPVHADYGFNVHISPNVFVSFNATFVDSCPIYIGSDTLVAPNVSFYAGYHPVDPAVRLGRKGPEYGAPITVESNCWIGGNVVVLPGVTIGKGSTVGAGSVVTKDVPPFSVVAGNPARIIRKIDTTMENGGEGDSKGGEVAS